MRHLNGLSALALGYDGFIIDLWGVVHDGIALFPGATECLEQLQGRPVLFLSNAPRRAGAVAKTLSQMGVPETHYASILTSGEAVHLSLAEKADPWFAALGGRVYHLGPTRDRNVIEGLPLTLAIAPEAADFLLNTGPDDQRSPSELGPYLGELEACLRAGLPMLCGNPDLEIVSGGKRILCAGALAAWYADHGGDVRSIGKPDPAIYERALAMLGVARPRVLAIGDSLRTDIAGAVAAGLDSVWVLGGLHAQALDQNLSNPAALAEEAGVAPNFTLPSFVW